MGGKSSPGAIVVFSSMRTTYVRTFTAAAADHDANDKLDTTLDTTAFEDGPTALPTAVIHTRYVRTRARNRT